MFVALLLVGNIGGLARLIAHSDVGAIAFVLLVTAMVLAFGTLAITAAVIRLGEDRDGAIENAPSFPSSRPRRDPCPRQR